MKRERRLQTCVDLLIPRRIASHAAPETPGSIHEGGELSYALSHAAGAVLDNPDVITFPVWCQVTVKVKQVH